MGLTLGNGTGNSALDLPQVSPVTEADEALYDHFFRKEWAKAPFAYGNNWAYICQAARYGPNKFCDGDSLITVTRKRKDVGSFEIVRPVGENLVPKIMDLCQRLRLLSQKPILIRKLEKNEYNILKCHGFRDADWNLGVLEELPDDIYPQPICSLEHYFRNGQISPQGMRLSKLRGKLNRFKNYGLNWRVERLTRNNVRDAKEALINWKGFFTQRYRRRHISVPDDESYYIEPYSVFLQKLSDKIDNEMYFSLVFYVENVPSGFSLLGRISDVSAAQYCNVGSNIYRGLSEFLALSTFREAFAAGVKYVNLGGAETESLFQYNQKFAPVGYERDHYLVY